MSDERFSDDTLFFVAEEDWRCYFEDIKGKGGVHADLVPEVQQQNFLHPRTELDMLIARQHPSAWSWDEPEASSQPPNADEFGVPWWRSETKAKPKAYKDTSTELIDMVKLCTAAEREGHGDLVWLSWNPRDNPNYRRTSLEWGSQLIAVSARGGR